jgi:hypothetical protein
MGVQLQVQGIKKYLKGGEPLLTIDHHPLLKRSSRVGHLLEHDSAEEVRRYSRTRRSE